MTTMGIVKILLLFYFLIGTESRQEDAPPSYTELNTNQGGFSSIVYHQNTGSNDDTASSFSEININFSDPSKHKVSSIIRESDLKELQKKLREQEHTRQENHRYNQQEGLKNNVNVPRFPTDVDTHVQGHEFKQHQGIRQVHAPNLGGNNEDFERKPSTTESPYLSLLEQSVRNYKNRLLHQTNHGNLSPNTNNQNEFQQIQDQNKPPGPKIIQSNKNRYRPNVSENLHSIESYESFKEGHANNHQRNRFNSEVTNYNKQRGQNSNFDTHQYPQQTPNNKGSQRNKYIVHGDIYENKKTKNQQQSWSEELIPSGKIRQEHPETKPILSIKNHFDKLNILNGKDTEELMTSIYFNQGNIRTNRPHHGEQEAINTKDNTLKTASTNIYNRPIVLPVKEFPGLGLSIDGDIVKLVPMPGSGIKLRPTTNKDHSSYIDTDQNKQNINNGSPQKSNPQNNVFSFQETKIERKKPDIQSVISQEPIKTYVNPVKVQPPKINLNSNENNYHQNRKPKQPPVRLSDTDSPLNHVQYHVSHLNKIKVNNVVNEETNGFQPITFAHQNKFPSKEDGTLINRKKPSQHYLNIATPRPVQNTAHLTNHKLVLPKPVLPSKTNRPNYAEPNDYETVNKRPKINESPYIKHSPIFNNPLLKDENDNDSKGYHDYDTTDTNINNDFQSLKFVFHHNNKDISHHDSNLDVPYALKLTGTSSIKTPSTQKEELRVSSSQYPTQKYTNKDFSEKPSSGYESFQSNAFSISNSETNLKQQPQKTKTIHKLQSLANSQTNRYPSVVNLSPKGPNEDTPESSIIYQNPTNDKTIEELIEAIALHKTRQNQHYQEIPSKIQINNPLRIKQHLESNSYQQIKQKNPVQEESHPLIIDNEKFHNLMELLALQNQKEIYEYQNEHKTFPLRVNRPVQTEGKIRRPNGGKLKANSHAIRPLVELESNSKPLKLSAFEREHGINLKTLLQSMKIDEENLNIGEESAGSQQISIQNNFNQQRLNNVKQQHHHQPNIPKENEVKIRHSYHNNINNNNNNNNPIKQNNLDLILSQIHNPDVIKNWPPKGTMEAIKSSINNMNGNSKLIEQPDYSTMPISLPLHVEQDDQHFHSQKEENKHILNLIQEMNNQKQQNLRFQHHQQHVQKQQTQQNSNEKIVNPELTKLISSIVPQATHQYKSGKHIITGPEENGVFYRIIVEDPYVKDNKGISMKLYTLNEADQEEELQENNEEMLMRKNYNLNEGKVNQNEKNKLEINQDIMEMKQDYNPMIKNNKTHAYVENRFTQVAKQNDLKLRIKDNTAGIYSAESENREYTTNSPKFNKPLTIIEEKQNHGVLSKNFQKSKHGENDNLSQQGSEPKIVQTSVDPVPVKTVTTQYLQQQAQLQQHLLEKQKQKHLMRLHQDQEEEKQKHLQDFQFRQQQLQFMEIEKKKQLQLQQEQNAFNQQRFQSNEMETLRKGQVAEVGEGADLGGAFSVSASYTIDSKSKH